MFVSIWSCPLCRVKEVGEIMQGKVKWFNQTKGFGFISPSDGTQDVFVHSSDIEGQGFKNLQEGATVEFEVTEGKKGPRATNVRPVE